MVLPIQSNPRKRFRTVRKKSSISSSSNQTRYKVVCLMLLANRSVFLVVLWLWRKVKLLTIQLSPSTFKHSAKCRETKPIWNIFFQTCCLLTHSSYSYSRYYEGSLLKLPNYNRVLLFVFCYLQKISNLSVKKWPSIASLARVFINSTSCTRLATSKTTGYNI